MGAKQNNASVDMGLLRAELSQRFSERIAMAVSQPISLELQHELSKAPCLTLSDTVALIQGLNPPPHLVKDREERQREYIVLDDFVPTVELLKRDWTEGEIAFPCTPAELIAWSEARSIELPVDFVWWVKRKMTEGAKPAKPKLKAPRKNDAQYKRRIVDEILETMIARAAQENWEVSKTRLPGIKAPYIELLKEHPVLKHVAEATLVDTLKHLGYSWQKGGKAPAAREFVDRFTK